MMGQRKQTKGQVESHVIEIIAKRTNIDKTQITRSRHLVDIGIVKWADVGEIIVETLARYPDLVVDSLDVVEIIMEIEEQVISEEQGIPTTVGDVIDYVYELLTHAPKSH